MERRKHGVGFAIRKSLLSMIELPTEGSKRILHLRLLASTGPVNILSIYPPTLSSTADSKDEFYNNLEHAVNLIPQPEPLILLGDFNARVGGAQENWPNCIGHFGVVD